MLVNGDGGFDNDKFIMDGPILKTAIMFDFEELNSYSIRVRTTDSGDAIYDRQFTINIIDDNDPPTGITLSNNVIQENRPSGAIIGFLNAVDDDDEDNHTFSLPDSNEDNSLFFIDGNELKTNIRLDFEERNGLPYTISVLVEDKLDASKSINFDIMVTDVSDSVNVNLHLSSTDFTFGKKLNVIADISSDASGALNAETVFEFSVSEGFIEEQTVFSSEGGVASVTHIPPLAGEWQVRTNWAGTNDFDAGQSIEHTFIVAKSVTNLELFYLGVPQILGQGRIIPGRLTLNNGNPGRLDISGLEISVVIGNGSSSQTFTATTDNRGNFEIIIPANFFSTEGTWDVTAEFIGNTNLNADNIGTEEKILVRQKHGYAILVQGSISTNEGAKEHANTLEFVQRSLIAAGFGTSFDDPDIRTISRNTPDAEGYLKDSIETWAKDKMLAAPAPLYIVLINHGEPKTFHMHPGELTSIELDMILDNLQSELANATGSLASEQAIITILGMCFSGSFIGELSESISEIPINTRIIISAAAPDEFSVRGPGEANERQGEQFVYLLFRELNKGLSLTESFRNSRSIIRRFSADRTLAINSSNPIFPGEKGQHPLLDDNGDMQGSSIVSDSSGDGMLASTIFLTRPTNAIPAPPIDRVNPTVFLPAITGSSRNEKQSRSGSPLPHSKGSLSPRRTGPRSAIPGQNIPDRMLWAEVDKEPEEILRIYMEVKKVADDTGINETSTMQHKLEFDNEPMDLYFNGDFVGYEWPRDIDNPNPFDLFTDKGTYQVFFYAESTDDREEISEASETLVYRASGNHILTDFDLLLPEDNSTLNYNPAAISSDTSLGVFTWDPSQSDGGDIVYILRVYHEDDLTVPIFESQPLTPTQFFLAPEIVDDGEIYWWDVVAVDGEGNSKMSSSFRQFTVDKPNFLPGYISGLVSDKDSGDWIADSEVNITEPILEIHYDQGFYIIVVLTNDDGYNLTAIAASYLSSVSKAIQVDPGDHIEVNFQLQSLGSSHTLRIISDPRGIPIAITGSDEINKPTNSVSMIANNTTITLNSPRVFTGENSNHLFVRWIIDTVQKDAGNTSVTFKLTDNITAEAVYRPVVGMILNPGWNLVSIPVTMQPATASAVFAVNGVVYDGSLWRWDGTKFQTSSEFQPGQGYWVNCKNSTFIETIGATPAPLTHPYQQGWNIVGIKGEAVFSIHGVALNNLGSIWSWESDTQTYYSIDSTELRSELQNKLYPGRGYWIYFNVADTV